MNQNVNTHTYLVIAYS